MILRFACLLFATLAFFPDTSAAKPKTAFVEYTFETKNFPLEWSLHEAGPLVKKQIGLTHAKPHLTEKDIGASLPNPFEASIGESHVLILKIKNTTQKKQYFIVTPHTVEPPEAAIDYYFECLCNHHVYEIPAKSEWMRVLRLNLGKNFTASKVKIVHILAGLNKKEVEKKYKDRVFQK